MRFLIILLLIPAFILSCKEGTSKVKSSAAANTQESTQPNDSEEDKNSSISKAITKPVVSQDLDSGNFTISFDEITMEEIRKNSRSDGGNNKKKPLVFIENGIEVEISNVFYLKSRSSRQIPTASPPNSLTGTIINLKINDGASFNFDAAMIGGLSVPKKLTIQGVRGKETVHKKIIELTHTNFKKYDFGFEDIETLIILAGINGAVFDDLEIRLN